MIVGRLSTTAYGPLALVVLIFKVIERLWRLDDDKHIGTSGSRGRSASGVRFYTAKRFVAEIRPGTPDNPSLSGVSFGSCRAFAHPK